ncbi:ESPR-type extended signal peptide-containing protein [Ursidibacter arcticus]
MNKVFKVIWNYSTQSWVAVSELAKGHAKSSSNNTNNISELNLDYPNTGKAASATVIGAALAVTVLTSVWSPTAYAAAPIMQGEGAKATGQDSIVFGTNANSSGTSDIAIGKSSFTNATNATAVGVSSKASAENASAFGAGAVASQLNSIAVGVNAKATANNATAIGQGAQAKHEKSIAIGPEAVADNTNTITIGYGAKATNPGAFAFGTNVSSRSPGSLGLGTDSVAWGNDSIAIGTSAKTDGGGNAISIGKDAYAKGKDSVAFGAGSNVTPERGSAFGANTTAGRWASAFGSNATASANRAVAVGEGATASKDNAVAIGNATNSSGANAITLGNQAEASGSNSVALGNGSTASATNALAFGNGANASTANSVALGNGATTDTAGTVSKLNFNKADASNNALSVAGMTGVTGTVSVGKSGALRQIQNVAAGRVTSSSTDAVNGSQLYTVMENVGFNIYENTAAKSRIDNNNKVTFADGNFTKANVSGTSDATVKFNVVTQDITSTEATKIANPTGTAGVAKTADVVNAINKAGFTLKANSETSGEAITNGDSVTIKEGKNINVTRAGSEITIKTADEVEFTSVKTGSLTATGPTNLNGGVSVEGGLAMNDGKITGLKAGTDKTDAVNVEQLDKVKEIAEKGWNVTIAKVEGGEAESASDTKVAPGDKVTHIAGKNIKLVQNGANITVSTTDKVNFSEVTADKTNAGELTATSATVNGPTTLNGTATVKDKLTAEKGATISGGNLEMSDNKITGLAEGVDGKDAVNVNQLKESGWKLKINDEEDTAAEKVNPDEVVTFKQGDNIVITREGQNVTVATSQTPTFTNLTTTEGANIGGKLDVTGPATFKDSVTAEKGATIKGGDLVMSDNKITGLKAGTDKTDAVNVEQLDEVKEIAEKGWNVTIAKVDGGEAVSASDTKVAPGDKVTHIAGKNIKLVQNGANITVSTTDKVNFSEVTADKTNAGELTATSATVNGPTTLNGTTTVKDKLTAEKGATIKGGDLEMSDNKITGLKAGTDDKDAVNVAQLNEAVNNLGWKLKINNEEDTAAEKVNNDEVVTFEQGDNIVITRDGKKVTVATSKTPTFTNLTTTEGANIGGKLDVTGPATFKDSVTAEKGATIKGGDLVMSDNKITGLAEGVDGKDAVNVNQLDKAKTELTEKGLKFKGETGDEIHKNLGETLEIVGKGNNINTTNTDGKIEISISDTPTFTNLTTTEGANIGGKLDVAGPATFKDSVTAEKGATIKGGDLVMSDNKITGLKAGTDKTDAVNVEQLDKVKEIAEKGWNVTIAKVEGGEAESASDTKVAPGDKVTHIAGKNIKLVQDGANITVSTTENVTFTNVDATTVNATDVNTTNVTSTGKANLNDLTVTGNTTIGGEGKTFAIAGKTSVDMGGNVVSNVAAGVADNDAVNVNQLKESGWKLKINDEEDTAAEKVNPDEVVTFKQGDNIVITREGQNVTVATSQTPTFTNLTTTEGANIGGKLDVAGPATFKDSVTAEKGATIKGGDLVMSDNKITGLAEGVDGKDAVNVDQLDKAKTELTEKGLKFKGENGEVIHKNLGEQLDIIGDGKNVSTTNEGGKIKITMSDTPSFTSLSTTEGANIGGDLNVSGSTTLGDTNVGGKGNTFAVKEGTKVDMGGNKISNVANGDISPNSTDAVNGAQIFALTGGQGAPNVTPSYTTTITNPDGSKTELKHENVVVDENGKPLLVTYNVQDQKEHVTNSVITAINHMNTQGIKFFHTNDGTAKAERPADQSENNEDSSASGAYATAVGYKATASGERAIAFGYDSTVTGTDSISIGTGNIVNGNNSGAFGDPSIIDADKSYSVGNDNRIVQGQSDVFVLGNNVTKTESNSVFLGTQSGYVAEGETTKGNSAHTSQTIGGETYQYAGGEASQVKGVVSVGNVAQDGTMETRRIQNVAPGLVSETSTDAINGSQLYSLHSVVDKGWNLTSGTVEGSNGVSNQSAPAKVGMGETVRVNAGQNIVVNQNGRTLDIATTMAPTFNSLKVNPNGKVDMGGNRIQNVGQAINAGDAVNYGQLKAELGKVDNRLRSGIAGAVASASLVQAFNPSESILAVGGGTYRGASALAVGYSKVSDNGKIIIKVTGSANNRGDYTGGASVGFKF